MGRFVGFFAAALTLNLTLAACGQSVQKGISGTDESAIINGQTAAQQDVGPRGLAESVVEIIASVNGGQMQATCTGTLIDSNIVLTAGHCLQNGVKPTDLIVILHILNPNQLQGSAPPVGVSAYRVQDFTVNPGFLKNQSNQDLALLRLAKPVPAGTRMATLPQPSLNVTQVPTLLAIGYGMSNDHHNTPQDQVGAGTLRYTSFAQNDFAVLPSTAQVSAGLQGMIAMNSAKTSICHGDSGGPLMISTGHQSTNIVVGVIESVRPSYQGQEQIDYQAVQTEAQLNAFYLKYPDAEICVGGPNLSVNVVQNLAWILATERILLAEPQLAVK